LRRTARVVDAHAHSARESDATALRCSGSLLLFPGAQGGSFFIVNRNRGVCGKPPNIDRGAVPGPTPRRWVHPGRRVHDRPHFRFWGQLALRPAQSAALRDGPMELERYDDGPGPGPSSPAGLALARAGGGSHCGEWHSQGLPAPSVAPLLAGYQGGWAGEEDGGS